MMNYTRVYIVLRTVRVGRRQGWRKIFRAMYVNFMETPSNGRIITAYFLKRVSLNSKCKFFEIVSFKLKLSPPEVLIFKLSSLKNNDDI
jgi:hypothetical protein